ncbi:type II toxin-antitoxin system VapC family toxin [Brucella sp. IR073]|uniref:type II toxin-antitoxin system VapC family toxin n=1 Tax=unclassified Brucella TaxID=2632610 RepID=UPI003B981E6A
MIAVDTSALMAIILNEPEADVCHTRLAENRLLISAGTIAEALIVSTGRRLQNEMNRLLEATKFQIIDVTPETARRIGNIYAKWGKGIHPAGLNFGDCFAYDVAKEHGCPLLYVGKDFAWTDIVSAL